MHLFQEKLGVSANHQFANKESKRGVVESNAVLVGRKPVMSYVFACMTMLQEGVNEVNVKARGRAISRAVDVAEIVRRKFQDEIKVKAIKIGTDQITDEQTNSPINVSTIEIVLAK